MRKTLVLVTLLLTVAQAWSVPIDETAARATAQRFLSALPAHGQMMSPARGRVNLAHIERSTKDQATPVYYVYNGSDAFVIVSGDDRAREILAYGNGTLDMGALPVNMKYWLTLYKRQLEFLQANPGIEVSAFVPSREAQSVLPLITAEWSQNAPYWNECPAYGADTCYTGCATTSLAMVFHYWKYPKQMTPAVPSYTTEQYGDVLAELPPTVFDWSNMLDRYASVNYTPQQAAAVAHLMRYIGQAEQMDYTISGSGALIDDILRAVKLFEYNQNARVYYKTDVLGLENYSDTQWAAMIQNELEAGRPVVYCAYDDYGAGGHAFNVDGYDATDDTYHVNWGWNGRGNGFFALNAFSYNGYNFGTSQQMLVGIQPPEDYQTPRLQAYPTLMDMECYINQTVTATLSLKGTNLTDDVTLTLNDGDGVFAIDQVTISRNEAEAGTAVMVTYSPVLVGSNNATITCTSAGTDPVTIALNGKAPLEIYDPVMLPADASHVTLTSFRADWSDETPSCNVASYSLEVQPKPSYSLIAEADFSDLPEVFPNNQAYHATDYLPEGWTFSGSEFNLEGGCVSIRRNGTITTSALNLTGYDKMTIAVTAKAYGFYGDGSELYVTTSLGTQELVFMYSYETKTIVVDCNATEQVVFTAGYYPMICDIKIYAGDATQGAALRATEEGDAAWRLVTGIGADNRNYTVGDLAEEGTFLYRIKALYIDGTESAWSNVEMVTLQEGGHSYEAGDVNHDGAVNISDVTALINVLLSKSNVCEICADVDGDHNITISDVTALINQLLSHHP